MAMAAAETKDMERCGETPETFGRSDLQSLVMDWLWKESEREGLRMRPGLPAGLMQTMMVLL